MDEACKLGKFFNIVFDNLGIGRMLFCPKFYRPTDGKNTETTAISSVFFYELCLGELYLHSVIKGLNRWKGILGEYNGEFQGNWKYYALSKRMNSIRLYGGDEDDYNPDGSVRTEVDNERLSCFTVINDLIPNEKDLFKDSRPSDLSYFARMLITCGKIDIGDIFKSCFGKKLLTYRMEEGKMVENSFSEEILIRIENENSAFLVANTLFAVCKRVRELVDGVKGLDRYEDNREFLSSKLPAGINGLLNLEVEPLNVFDPADIIEGVN